MIIVFCLLLIYAPLDWGGRHMRAATLVHFLVVIVYLIAIFSRSFVWYKFPKDIVNKLQNKICEDKLATLAVFVKKYSSGLNRFKVFSKKDLFSKLQSLELNDEEIELVLEQSTKNASTGYIAPYLAPFLLLFLCWAFLSTTASICIRPSFEELIRLTDYIILTWIISSYFDKKSSIPVISTIIISGSIVSFLGIFFLLLSGSSPGMEFRAYSTFYQSDAFAGYLLLIAPLSICLSFLSGPFWRRVFLMVGGVIFISCLFLSQSRGAWLCLIVVIVVILVGLRKQKFLLILMKIVFFLGAAWLFASFFPHPDQGTPSQLILDKIGSISNLEQSSVVARFQFWIGAVKIAIKNPFLGIGLGNFGRVYPVFQENVLYFSHYTHNYYAQIAAETGIVGFAFLMLIVFVILFWGLKLIIRGEMKDNDHYLISLGLFSSILASMMHSFIDVDWNFPAIPHLFWIQVGLFFVFISEFLPVKRFHLFKNSKLILTTIKVVVAIFEPRK